MSKTAVVENAPKVLINLARAYREADKAVDDLDAKRKEAERVRYFAEKRLLDQMVTEEIKSFKVEGLGGFRKEVKAYPNIVDRLAMEKWIKRHKDARSLFTMSVHAGKLKTFVRERLENGETIPDGVETFMKPKIVKC